MLSVLCALGLLGATPPDPYLPEGARAAVERASAAELDPKRGVSNAVETLKSERAKMQNQTREAAALELRVAGTVLRGKFMTSREFEEPARYQQALSTFSRLDLAEPGLRTWIDRTIALHPEAKKQLAKKSDWKVRAAILTRGSGLDREAIARAFAAALAKVGATLEVVPAKGAPMVLTLAAEDAPRAENGDIAVRLSFGAESIQDGKVVWRSELYRIEAAKDPKVALAASLDWMSRIGGRDLFFRWLGERGLSLLAETKPGPGGHDHGPHGGGITPAGQSEQTPLKVKIPSKSARPKSVPSR
jgi:hypothetical protein